MAFEFHKNIRTKKRSEIAQWEYFLKRSKCSNEINSPVDDGGNEIHIILENGWQLNPQLRGFN